MATNEYRTVREIAVDLRLATETVRRWITDLPPGERLPATQFGRNPRYLVKTSDLEVWLAKR